MARALLGKIYLVGAGPGNPDLLTLKGKRCLEQADVVLYDRLVDESVLDFAAPETELVYVGREPGRHCLPQREKETLMIRRAAEGKIVVRLKGGDPFVFGRGGEEAEALAKAGIPFEIVPGVSSAVAAPAYAGIPLTHRKFSSSFAIVTGHEEICKGESSIRWDQLATAVDTIVVLMGASALPRIVSELLAHGRPPRTPVALIRWGTTDAQLTITGTLSDIVSKAVALRPPVVAVIGEVVTLREKLRWFESPDSFYTMLSIRSIGGFAPAASSGSTVTS